MADSNTSTYTLPNYTGQLFMKGARPNAFLQMLGGITGYQTTKSVEFASSQDYSLASHMQQGAPLEGATAPDASGVARTQSTNVVQIFHETVSVNYTKQAATGQLSGLNTAGAENPVVSELDFQTAAKLEYISRNLNWVMVNGVYQKPADNTTGRKTRGILAAITTNVRALGAGTALTKSHLQDMMKMMVDSGSIADGDNVICLSNTNQLAAINALYESEFNKTNQTRDVGGIRVRSVMTAFGQINFALEMDMPQTSLAFINFGVISLVGLEVPDKGVLFREALAKTGSDDRYQLYGELGLNHGPEHRHGKITGLS